MFHADNYYIPQGNTRETAEPIQLKPTKVTLAIHVPQLNILIGRRKLLHNPRMGAAFTSGAAEGAHDIGQAK